MVFKIVFRDECPDLEVLGYGLAVDSIARRKNAG